MAATKPAAALNQYLTPLRRAIAVLSSTAVVLTDCRDPADGLEHQITLAKNQTLRVGNSRGDAHYYATVRQRFQIVADAPEPRSTWRVRVAGYQYMLADADEREILSYHLHPGQDVSDTPHLHIKGLPLRELQKAHLPTAHVTVEAFIRLLIRDFQVQATTQDYRRVLDDCEKQSAQAYSLQRS